MLGFVVRKVSTLSFISIKFKKERKSVSKINEKDGEGKRRT
jgi:hypothetical protein